MKAFRLSLLSFLLTGATALAGEGWMTDFDAAFKKAAKEKKPVLVEFTGSDWCPPCKQMRKDVFTKKDFITKASKDFILVELDFPRGNPDVAAKNKPYAEKYKVTGFPTVILFDHDKKEFNRFVASKYPSVEKFLAHLKKSLSWKDLE